MSSDAHKARGVIEGLNTLMNRLDTAELILIAVAQSQKIDHDDSSGPDSYKTCLRCRISRFFNWTTAHEKGEQQ